MDLKNITLLVFDEFENFHSQSTQLRIGKKLYNENVFLIQNEEDFKEKYLNLKTDEKFFLICHVFHKGDDKNASHRGLLNLINSQIEELYSIKALLVSSGDSGEVMKNIYSSENINREVYSYSKIRDEIKLDKIKPYTRAELEKSKTGEISPNDKSALKNGIFLSHSSKDAEIVEKFKDLILQGGLEYDLNKIKFTSREDHGIPAGVDIPDNLKNFIINEMGLFIQFISSDYKESRVCLNEEGAAWCLMTPKMFIPILIAEFKSSDISWVNSIKKAIRLNNKESLMNIYEDRKEFFGGKVNITRLDKKINEFIDFVNKKITF